MSEGCERSGEPDQSTGFDDDITPVRAVVEAASERFEECFFDRKRGGVVEMAVASPRDILEFGFAEEFCDEVFLIALVSEPIDVDNIDAGT